jgi:hypothetical protein
MLPKNSPLETFLSTVSPSPAAARPPAGDHDVQAGARAVLLTIVGRTGSVSEQELKMRSELAPDLFQTILQGLVQDRLVDIRGADCVLTDEGRVAAERERQRLLSW